MKKDTFSKNRSFADLIPSQLRNQVNTPLLQNLFDRYLTKEESIPMYGHIGRKDVGNPQLPKIAEQTVDRSINSIIPVYSFKDGATDHHFTPYDLILKAKTMGISGDLDKWLHSQGSNFLPPIDIDKFTNFYQYYWIGDSHTAKQSKPNLEWNSTRAPEYYVIARPKLSDNKKMNVAVATTNTITKTGCGFYDLGWDVTFTSEVDFTVAAVGNTYGIPQELISQEFSLPILEIAETNPPIRNTFTYSVDGRVLLKFTITRDFVESTTNYYQTFAEGDKFTITAKFIDSNYYAAFKATGGDFLRGGISSVSTLDKYQVIDGYQLKSGDRVLVKDAFSLEQGIYIVTRGEWVLAEDNTNTVGDCVFISNGTQGNSMYHIVLDNNGDKVWTKLNSGIQNTNDWQEGNFWVSKNYISDKLSEIVDLRAELTELNSIPVKSLTLINEIQLKTRRLDTLVFTSKQYDLSTAVQATRPIIEYSSEIELNDHFSLVGPAISTTPAATKYNQRKTEFNQLPLFNLYRYDGTFTNMVSAIFFYAEDPTQAIDVALQKRAAMQNSADFVFNHGLFDDGLLFYKAGGELKTIWGAGFENTVAINSEFTGLGNGTVQFTVKPNQQQQVISLTAESPTSFIASSSKFHSITPNRIIVGQLFQSDIFSCTITAGTQEFNTGDVFKIMITGQEQTRFVSEINGVTKDQYIRDDTGCFMYPRMFSHNPHSTNEQELVEGSLYSHFNGILTNQINSDLVPQFGGSIKLWSKPVSLLSSLLMQKDLSPPSVLEFGQRQYEAALGTVVDLYLTNIVSYFSGNEFTTGTEVVNDITTLVLEKLASDVNSKTVLMDSTMGVAGFPLTLPALGIIDAQVPGIVFDNVFNNYFIQHHDGHLSPLYEQDEAFTELLFSKKLKIVRSNGVETNVISEFSATPPNKPYKGSIWRTVVDGQNKTMVFMVDSDSVDAPKIMDSKLNVLWKDGQVWYNRNANKIYKFNSVSNTWVISADSILNYWVEVDFAQLLNDVIVNVELELLDKIENFKQAKFKLSDKLTEFKFSSELAKELSQWANLNNLDAMAPNYKSSDPFTWNYSYANSAEMGITGAVPARWFNVLMKYQSKFGQAIPTIRPNLEPWKLIGHSTKPNDWDARFKSKTDVEVFRNQVKCLVVDDNANASYSGLRIIDGVMVKDGDTVLLAGNRNSYANGLWIANSSNWNKLDSDGVTINVQLGYKYAGTKWTTIDESIVQIRLWSNAMWELVRSYNPAMKISVDSINDTVLPPYVNSSLRTGADAITNVIPDNTSYPYSFGEDSPAESIWRKTMDFGYSLCKAFFKHAPLEFLDEFWGFEMVEVDGIKYEMCNMAMPSPENFRLHGDTIEAVSRTNAITIGGFTSDTEVELSIRRVGVLNSHQIFEVCNKGVHLDYLIEGQVWNFTPNSDFPKLTITGVLVEDHGIPFRFGDEFTITGTSGGRRIGFTSASSYTLNGVGQWFTQSLRELGIDSSVGYAIAAYKNWDLHVGYRVGGLVADQELALTTTQSTLNDSSFKLQVKSTDHYRDAWLQAFRVSIVQIGSSRNGYAGKIPVGAADDWIFRIEGFNGKKLSVVYNKLKTTGEYATFNAIEKAHTDIDWKQFSEVVEEVEVNLPITIKGLQNTINFIFGYVNYLESQGWMFDELLEGNVDATTGRVMTWQLGIEKLIDTIYAGTKIGNGHIINPFVNGVWLSHDEGLVSKFTETALFDVNVHSGAYDILGTRIPVQSLNIIRGKEKTFIGGNTPIFCLHAQITIYEHLLILANYIESSTKTGMIYNPFSGSKIAHLAINGKKQASTTLRPEMGGYFISNNKVVKNIQSSIDGVSKYYDANSVFEDRETSNRALALLGYSQKPYMDDMDFTDKTQFNFWRGLIHMKGTNMSLDAFLNSKRFDDARIDEYWAFKVAEYGDNRRKTFPELLLSSNDCLQQFTKFVFNNPTNELVNFINVDTNDERRWVSESDLGENGAFETKLIGTYNYVITQDDLDSDLRITVPFYSDYVEFDHSKLTQLNSTTFDVIATGAVSIKGYSIDADKHSPLKLINYVDKEVVEDIPYWNPINNVHTPYAYAQVHINSDTDPAKYNYSTQVIGNNNYDPYKAWGANEVGRIWWDTTNLEYIPYTDVRIFPNMDDRLNRWGALSEFSDINICEWVESDLSPADFEINAISANQNSKVDGRVYGAKTYSRNRLWKIVPIAWSKAGVPNKNAHPSLQASFNSTLYFRSSGLISLDTGTFDSYAIVEGMRIGLWQEDDEFVGPLNEFIITSDFSKQFIQGSDEFISETNTAFGITATVNLSVSKYTKNTGNLVFVFDETAGDFETSSILNDEGLPTGQFKYSTYLRIFNNGKVSKTLIDTQIADVNGPMVQLYDGQTLSFDTSFGITITLSIAGNTLVNAADIAKFIEITLANTVSMQDAVRIEEITNAVVMEIEGMFSPTVVSNDPIDPINIANNGIGWRAWHVPTQKELDADGRFPNSVWKPYIGPSVFYQNPSLAIINDAKTNGEFTLNDGSTVSKYETSWDEWTYVPDDVRRIVSTGGLIIEQYGSILNRDNVSVYKNGVLQIIGSYQIIGKFIQIPDTAVGDFITILNRSYIPTSAELAFDPQTKDDLAIQIQYKKDYQYVVLPIRNSDGVVGSYKYYFWATNKSNASGKLSTSVIAEMLKSGPTQYVSFHRTNSMKYDAIAISGINYIVGKNDTFKLRLVNDYTLREDPNQIDLKDTHAEWKLIRPGQRTRVPKELWDKIVDAACGQNIAGQKIPSFARISYDERNHAASKYGFGEGQIVAPSDVVIKTIFDTITKYTKVVREFDINNTIEFIGDDVLDWNNPDSWFATPASTRNTLTRIWELARPQHANEIVFAVINDICAFNPDLDVLMKTSRLSAYSIKIVQGVSSNAEFE